MNTDQAAILLRTCARKTKARRKTGINTILNILLLFRIKFLPAPVDSALLFSDLSFLLR